MGHGCLGHSFKLTHYCQIKCVDTSPKLAIDLCRLPKQTGCPATPVSEALAMLNQSLTAKRIFLNACLLIVAMLVVAAGAFARTQDPAERQKAIDLDESNNSSAALPLLEKVATANPDDAVI